MIAFSSYAYYSIPCLTAWRVARKHFLILHSGVADRSLVSIFLSLSILFPRRVAVIPSPRLLCQWIPTSTRATRPEDKKFICCDCERNSFGSLITLAAWAFPL